jgi:hypothetical protein
MRQETATTSLGKASRSPAKGSIDSKKRVTTCRNFRSGEKIVLESGFKVWKLRPLLVLLKCEVNQNGRRLAHLLSQAMIGENRQLVTNEPVELSLRINRLKFKTSGELPITLEEFMEHTSNQYRKTEGCQYDLKPRRRETQPARTTRIFAEVSKLVNCVQFESRSTRAH